MEKMEIQFVDLKAQQDRIKKILDQRISNVLSRGAYIMGPEVSELEQKLTIYSGSKHCIACANGTDALLALLMALDIQPGDLVLVPSFTFIATAEVISLLHAIPVFVDIDPATFNISVQSLESLVSKLEKENKRAKGIICVDLFGQPADYSEILEVAQANDLFVIEDAAQSFGAKYENSKTCAITGYAATSFFPSKPLGCYGDGGAVFCDSDEFASKLRSIRVHGQGSHKYENIQVGMNSRLDTLQAAVLLAKLEIFEEELELRNQVAERYTEGLKDHIRVPLIKKSRTSVWAQYSIMHDSRDQLSVALKAKGIPTMIYYPVPLHLQKVFSTLGYTKGDLPISEDAAGKILSLPMHPYLRQDAQMHIISSIIEGVKN